MFDFKPILISDFLTFISSMILLIITWKSVSNAKKSNEITMEALKVSKQAVKLQKQQFDENIKPSLLMNFPKVITEKGDKFNEKFVSENESMLFGDYPFSVKNRSENIAYNVRVYLYLYLDNKTWMEYKNKGFKKLPILFNIRSSYHLDSNGKLECSIPNHYFRGDMERYTIYILFLYESKTGVIYEEGYVLRELGHIHGGSHKSVDFEPKDMNPLELKEIVLEQKTFLEKNFDHDLFYYFVPK